MNGSCEIRGFFNFYRNVFCDCSWVGLNFFLGFFIFLIMVIDIFGNFGGFFSYMWINGMVFNVGFEINICNLICKLNILNLCN